MTNPNPTLLTHESLLAAGSAERTELVLEYLLASIRRLIPGVEVDAGTRLGDLGVDSLQVVELKFGLDEVIGAELDIEVIIANPTIRELAEESLRREGL